jgi:glutamyl-tRNA synthetase
MHPDRHVTRLAPSPTGALHLGNARTFLVNWALARKQGWRIVLRIEDLDGPRVKPQAAQAAIEILRWLGLDWDEGPYFQSADPSPYRSAMASLCRRGLAYPCLLSRAEVEGALSAPQEGSGEVVFPASLRPSHAGSPRSFDDDAVTWRLLTPAETVVFEDRFAGRQEVRPWAEIGDFVVWTRQGVPAYQLAVVVDDHRQGVTQVVRGDDLIPSTGRQILLYRALGLGPVPAYTHLPLVRGSDGRRLAKRHGDTRLERYRAGGVDPRRVVALLGAWCGMADLGPRLTCGEFRDRLDLCTIPREPVVFTPEDDAWLNECSDRPPPGPSVRASGR